MAAVSQRRARGALVTMLGALLCAMLMVLAPSGAYAAEASSESSSSSSAPSAPAEESEASPPAQSAASDDGGQANLAADPRGGLSYPWVIFIVCVVVSAIAIGASIGILRGYRNR